MLLADMGADVIKVERPGRGDPFRSFEEGLYGPQFQAFNRNKRSIQLDLDDDADRASMWQLLESADVYVQNFRPGVVERLGFRRGGGDARAIRASCTARFPASAPTARTRTVPRTTPWARRCRASSACSWRRTRRASWVPPRRIR